MSGERGSSRVCRVGRNVSLFEPGRQLLLQNPRWVNLLQRWERIEYLHTADRGYAEMTMSRIMGDGRRRRRRRRRRRGRCRIGTVVVLLLRRCVAALVLGRRKLKIACTVDCSLWYEHGMLSLFNHNCFSEDLKITEL